MKLLAALFGFAAVVAWVLGSDHAAIGLLIVSVAIGQLGVKEWRS